MASNNDPRKNQKGPLPMLALKRAAKLPVDTDVIVDGDSSSSSTPVNVISLSFGNILQQFPDLLMELLPYIADRKIFNAIVSCNRETNEKSKLILPPWPKDYQLPASNEYSIAIWSPDGTRVAYTVRYVITIVHQRHGIIHRINNNHGVHFCELKFSPDGRHLVSTDVDNIVKFWDNNVDGNYKQLQECNMREDVGENRLQSCSIDISACSKYIVMGSPRYMSNRIILKRVENGETIRSLTPQPVMNYITKVMFSVDCDAVFIHGLCGNYSVIKLWRPYLNDTGEDSLITLWKREYHNYDIKIIVSHDTTMMAIQDFQDTFLYKGWVLSIDNNYNCTVQKFNIEGSDVPVLLQFTSDDESIIYATKKRLKHWSVTEKKFTDNECLFYNKRTMNNLKVVNCSPNERQLIIRAINKKGYESLCMKSIL